MKNNSAREILNCEVCGNQNLEPVLNLGRHPMCDDLIKLDDNKKSEEYEIEILYCRKCNTAHQRYQVPKEFLFPNTYHYRSRFTADVLNGMSDLVNSCQHQIDSLENKKILDIGCNDGSLLDFFLKKGAITIGVEPTDAYLDAKEKGHKIYNNYLNEDLAIKILKEHGNIDVIVFTNVFAHIEDLPQVLRSLKILISEKTIIIIENHYLGSVLDRSQFDTFYHEHPRTYSYCSFLHMALTLNTQIISVEFPSRYGGNIRVCLGKSINKNHIKGVDTAKLEIRENQFFNDFQLMQNNIVKWIKRKRSYIISLYKKHGKLRAKAFPGRAAILVKLLSLDENIIDAVFEKPGSLKIGNFVPGTRIPIHSDENLFAMNDQSLPIINLAWHIPKEIKKYLLDNGYKGSIINIIEDQDFTN